MNNSLITPCNSGKQIKTKRHLLIELYTDFKTQINEIIDVSYIFPKNDEDLDIADVVFHISFLFPQGCDVRTIVKVLIRDTAIIKGISYTDDQVEKALPIVERFLQKYYTIYDSNASVKE